MHLGETIAIRTSSGATIPVIGAGVALPTTFRETLSTARDGEASLRCELVTLSAGLVPTPSGRPGEPGTPAASGVRSAARLEVGIAPAPRGVAKVLLVVRVDAHGSVHATLDAEHGNASASFSVRCS